MMGPSLRMPKKLEYPPGLETPGRQTKQSSQLSLFPNKMIAKQECKVTKYRTITESCIGSNNQQRINNRITAFEQTAAYISGVIKLHFTGTKSSP